MPSALEYVAPTDPSRNRWTQTIIQEKQARENHYRKAVSYYMNEHDRQLELPEEGDYDANTTINLVQMTADRTVSFLFAAMPEVVLDHTSIEDTEQEKYLKSFFKSNGGLKTFAKLALRGFLAGHSFVRVQPPKYPGRMPSMSVLDPTQVTVFWAADNFADVVWYETRYYIGDVAYVEDVVRTGAEQWSVYVYRESNRKPLVLPSNPTIHGRQNTYYLDRLDFGASFEQVGSPAIHSSEIPPIIDIPHLPHPDDYYGYSEFTQKNLQDAINHLSSVRSQIVRENAEPVDVITGAGSDEVQMGSVISIENPAARVTRLEMKGDLQGISSTIDSLVETYLAVARVVLLKGEAKDLQRVTNASVRTLFLDALSKNELLRSSYGEGIEKIAKLALDIGYSLGMVPRLANDVEPSVKFATPLPVDDMEIANINAMALAGRYMDKRTAAQRLDLNWAETLEGMTAEAKNPVLTNITNDATIKNRDSGDAPLTNSAGAQED